MDRPGLQASDAFRQELETAAEAARGFSSGHRYDLAEFGLDPETLNSRFAHIFEIYEFDQDRQGTGA